MKYHWTHSANHANPLQISNNFFDVVYHSANHANTHQISNTFLMLYIIGKISGDVIQAVRSSLSIIRSERSKVLHNECASHLPTRTSLEERVASGKFFHQKQFVKEFIFIPQKNFPSKLILQDIGLSNKIPLIILLHTLLNLNLSTVAISQLTETCSTTCGL